MKLEDLLVMEVPIKQLRHVCTTNKIKPGGNSSEVYAKCISTNTKLRSEAELLIDEFRYAGKTTVRLYKPLDPELEKFNSINYFKEFLKRKYGESILTTGIRTTPAEIPNLFKAVEYNGKYFLSFVYLGQERRIFRNYEIVREKPQNVDFLVVHFNPLLLQVRVPVNKDRLFKQSFLNVLNINNSIDWFNNTELSDSEIRTLIAKLKCGLVCAKHKMTEGIYDTVELRAKPDVNLADEPEYKNSYDDKPYRSARIQFPFKCSNGLEENISLQITKEGINFYNEVSEEIIQYVINNVLNVKFPTNDQVASGRMN